MILSRFLIRSDGIFGHLSTDNAVPFGVTLEHAFPQPDGSYAPKIPTGTYTCQRGMHQLHHMTDPFQTFEVLNVPGHTGILFHVGNYNTDSDGCILVGSDLGISQGIWMITRSADAFERFMNLHEGQDAFTLTVQDEI